MLRRSKVTLKSTSNNPDYLLATLVLGLTIFGVIMVGNASVVEAYRDFGDKFYYLKLQFQWAVLGFLAFLFSSKFSYRRLKILVIPLLVFTIFSLIVVLLPRFGIKALGASRWIGVGRLRYQPGELAKFALVLWSAVFLSKKKKFFQFLIILGLFVGLIMLEPDLGTAIVVASSSFLVYFASGASVWQIGILGLGGLLAGGGLILSSPYRKQRLLTFLNPSRDPLGASYHIRQILIALGSGGLTGLGLGQSRQKFEYLPEVTTDSIFAIIAEELGFVGAMFIVLTFLFFIWRGFRIAKRAPDEFGRLLAVGIVSWIGVQALVNLSAMVALVPLTGVPLPFISYGGSSLILTLFGAGILVNISRSRVVRK